MSKKQTAKKKVILKLKAQESYVQADNDFFIRLAESLELLAKNTEDKVQKNYLITSANFVRNSSYENTFNPQENDYSDDWD
jgi:hypothetical protein